MTTETTTESFAQLQEKYIKLEKELKDQLDALGKQRDEARKAEKSGVIAQIKALISQYDILIEDLSSEKPAKTAKKEKVAGTVAPKYRGPDGQTWTGRGRQPKWLEGADREAFLIRD